MSRRNILERPEDYVTEENFLASPQVKEGPTSPKKQLSRSSFGSAGIASVPDIDASDSHHMSDKSSFGYDGEDAVLVLSDGDESDSYQSDASDFEPLPPPIEIPDALKPKEVLQAETKAQPRASRKSKLEDSSSDESDDSAEDRRKRRENFKSKPAPKPKKVVEKKPTPKQEDESSDDDIILTVKPDPSMYHSPVKDAAEIMAKLTASQKQLATSKLDDSNSSSSEEETIEKEVGEEYVIQEMVVDDSSAPAPAPMPAPATAPAPVPPVQHSAGSGDGNNDYAWKKPDWAKKGPSLKSTGKDTKGYLSKPITNLPQMGKKYEAGYDKDPAPELTPDILPSPLPAPAPTSVPAASAAPTPSLAPTSRSKPQPVTVDDNEPKDYAWEKPSWAKNGPKLRATGKADKMKAGNLAAPVTNIRDYVATEKQELDFQRPDLSKDKLLKGTTKGEALKTGGDIARPIGGIKQVEED